jgi:WD40 repeat protein
MGCNYNHDDSENDFEILNNNQNYLLIKNGSKTKNNEIRLKSVIEDYKVLHENAKNVRKIKLKSKRKEVYPFLKKEAYLIKKKEKGKNPIAKIKLPSYSPNTKNQEIIKQLRSKMLTARSPEPTPAKISYFKDVTKDSFSYFYLDNTFTVFNSVNNILYLVYATKDKSIISYNLIEDKKIIEIKNAHKELVVNFRYYCDKEHKRDLIISISYDNNIKLWNVNQWECLCDFSDINKSGYSLSACFLKDKDEYYIITSSYSDNTELLKVYNLNGQKIKNIDNAGDETSFIDTYFDNKLSKYYIITGNIGYVASYDYNENKLYHKYGEDDMEDHCSVIVNEKEEIIKLIESCGDGNIRIWNFHTGELVKKIMVTKKRLFGLCLWNEEYLFIGCEDKTIKLIELKTGDVINNLIGNNKIVLTIKKLFHPKFGKCLLSQGNKDNQIKLWINKK